MYALIDARDIEDYEQSHCLLARLIKKVTCKPLLTQGDPWRYSCAIHFLCIGGERRLPHPFRLFSEHLPSLYCV